MEKFIVLSIYTDGSYNETHRTYVVEDRKTAVKLGNAILDAFVKTELADGWEKDEFEKWGDFKTLDNKVIWNEKHQQRVKIMKMVEVSDFEIVEERDEYGKFYFVETK